MMRAATTIHRYNHFSPELAFRTPGVDELRRVHQLTNDEFDRAGAFSNVVLISDGLAMALIDLLVVRGPGRADRARRAVRAMTIADAQRVVTRLMVAVRLDNLSEGHLLRLRDVYTVSPN